jgi:RHS repeat-associated protein
MQQGTTKYWLLGDHLGSTSYTLNGTTESGELRYRAFGVTRFSSGTTPTSYRYTGQREEAGLGLYYYGARWYDPALGRFIQPDTIVPDPGNPADFDRYAYVRNNPLRYTDPSGHCTLAASANGQATIQHTDCDFGGQPIGPLLLMAAAAVGIGSGYLVYRGVGEALTGLFDTPADSGVVPQESFPLTPNQPVVTTLPLNSADGLPTVVPPSQLAGGQTVPSLLVYQVPPVDPRGHIYAADRGAALANTANRALRQLDRDLRRATVAAAQDNNGKIVLAVFGSTRTGTERAVAQLRSKGWNVLDASSVRTSAYHAERQLYEAGYTEIGISRQQGMCDTCEVFFQDKPHVRITPYEPQ